MRTPVLAAVAVLLFSQSANAADDDLPAGDSDPHVRLTGVGDAYYAYHDTPPPGREATFMTTASRHNEFALNLAALGVKLEHSKLTGTILLQFGTSVDELYKNTNSALKYVQLANVGWRAGDLTLEAGVLPSLVGRESFISTENWNYARALVAESTPYFLAGARATYQLAPTVKLGATVANGWSTYRGAGSFPTGQLFVSWKPTDSIEIDDTVLASAQTSDVVRLFEDLVVWFKVHDRVELALEGWVSREQGFHGTDPIVNGLPGNEMAAYETLDNPFAYGGALWAKWKFAQTVYFAGRIEGISDRAGALTGTGARDLRQTVSAGQKLAEGTLTVGWQPHPRLLGRVEAMHRISDQPYFVGENDDPKKQSTTFVVSAAVSF